MTYVLLVIIPAALMIIIPSLAQIILLLPVYVVLRAIQIVLRFFGGKDYGR